MELPQELGQLINEFARPITRPDWKQGCALNRFINLHNKLWYHILYTFQDELDRRHWNLYLEFEYENEMLNL